MQRFRDTVLMEGPSGLQPTRGAAITVYIHGTETIATIYENNTYATKANPFNSNAQGAFYFYADNGRYDVGISGAGSELKLVDVLMEDILSELGQPNGVAVLGPDGLIPADQFPFDIQQIEQYVDEAQQAAADAQQAAVDFDENGVRKLELASPAGTSLIGNNDGQTLEEVLASSYKTSPFGLSGLQILLGEKGDAHYGFGGILNFASGKWVHIYRKANDHAQTNGAELRARDSYNQGKTWGNDRLIYSEATNDARPDAPAIMGNNRGGFFVNRQAGSGGTAKYPLFVKTDNEGSTFTLTEVPTSSLAFTFQGHSGLMVWPASKGGNDTLGYMTFGFIDSGGIDAFVTADNGESWSIRSNVAVPGLDMLAISESTGVRLQSPDRWIFWSRSSISGGWRPGMITWLTDDPFNWGSPRESGINLYGNPPGGFIDEATSTIHVLNFGRGGRGIDNQDHHLLHVAADAELLWAANGNFATLGLAYSVLAAVPNWSTGYLSPFLDNRKRFATFTCGEPGTSGGNRGALALIGDFTPSDSEQSKWIDMMQRRLLIKSVGLTSDDGTPQSVVLDNIGVAVPQGSTFTVRGSSSSTQADLFSVSSLNGSQFSIWGNSYQTLQTGGGDYTLTLLGTNSKYKLSTSRLLLGGIADRFASDAQLHIPVVSASKAAITTESTSVSGHTHHVLRNPNGVVGSISTAATSTAFNTTSDESWKEFVGQYDPRKAIDIIRRDPVREFNWAPQHGGGHAVGWGAQTSYGVSKDLASPGGWKDPITGDSWEKGASRWVCPITNDPWNKGAARWVCPFTGEPSSDGVIHYEETTLDSENVDDKRSGQKKVGIEALRIDAKRIDATYVPWGVDQSKRTPYLWAALSWAIEKIESLERQIANMTEQK